MKNKYDHLKYSLLLVGISLFLTLCVGYVDEGRHSLKYLSNPKEIGLVLVFTFIKSALPLFLYHYLLETRIRKYSFVLSLTGFLPPFLLLAWLVS